jgi:uncharacterized protein involved in exopolysaccharide biosynthesis
MSLDLRFYWHLLLRRLPVMLFLVVATTVAGLLVAAGLPTTYVSQARLLVQGQSISEDLAASTVQIDGLEEVQLLREQVLTRANLIDIATRLNVFENLNEMNPTEVYNRMQEATRVNAQGGGATRRDAGSPVLLTFEFSAREAQIAADVLNEYVTQVLAASVRLRTGQARETLSFFEQEVQRLGDELERRSTRITEFQRDNADALPSDQDFRLQRQSLLQERIAAAERERRELIDTRERTIQIFQTGAMPQTNLTPDQQQLQELQAELSDMLLTFSESSTRVQLLRRRIERLEERIALQAEAGNPALEPLGNDNAEPMDPILALQLAEIDSRIEALDTTLEESERELDSLNAAISRAPLNAIQLQRLEREYQNVQLQFENARNALAQASIGERLEVGGRGQRITLLEPPVVPNRPDSPNRRLIAVGSFGAGIGLALAFFVVMELMNRSVRRPAELVRALGVTPFGVLPSIETARSRFLRRSYMFAKIGLLVAGVPAALWAVNEFYMPLDQLSEMVLTQLGLA